MKKIIFIVLSFLLAFNSFGESYFLDEFEDDLNALSAQRDIGLTVLLTGVLGLSAGFVGGSTFTTLNSMGVIDNSLAQPMIITSYVTVSLSAIVGVVGFLIWKDGVDKYLETLRLRDQYYNLTY
jgi:hypothetical protein